MGNSTLSAAGLFLCPCLQQLLGGQAQIVYVQLWLSPRVELSLQGSFKMAGSPCRALAILNMMQVSLSDGEKVTKSAKP